MFKMEKIPKNEMKNSKRKIIIGSFPNDLSESKSNFKPITKNSSAAPTSANISMELSSFIIPNTCGPKIVPKKIKKMNTGILNFIDKILEIRIAKNANPIIRKSTDITNITIYYKFL